MEPLFSCVSNQLVNLWNLRLSQESKLFFCQPAIYLDALPFRYFDLPTRTHILLMKDMILSAHWASQGVHTGHKNSFG